MYISIFYIIFFIVFSTQDIQILLTRPSNQKTFATKAKSLASYLNKLISGVQSQSGFDVTECTANIDTWTRNEVKLLSEMTMESLHELMSPYVRYDDRWNEIFAKEHPSVLKELEVILLLLTETLQVHCWVFFLLKCFYLQNMLVA